MIFMGMTPVGMLFLAIGMAFIVGFTGPIVDGPLFAVMQSTVEPGMQGRVFTLINSLTGVMTPIGLLIAGPIADTFGVRTWYIAGGIVTALLGLVSFAIPAILRIEDGRAPRLVEKEEPVLSAGN
jgi:DHA3 family macrolide efflux protein-like MFS transporter